MSYRWLRFLAVPVLALVTPVLATTSAAGQSPVSNTARRPADVPPTPWGDPDLQGIWSSSGATPMERPDEYQGRETLSDEDIALIRSETSARDQRLLLAAARRTEAGGNVGAYNNFWMDQGTNVIGTRRTSLIIDPPNGRLPEVTETGRARAAANRGSFSSDLPASYTDLSNSDRCLMGFNAGPPMRSAAYNNNVMIFQTPGYVTILNEMVHNARIIPIGDSASPPFPQYSGVSRGHWEGETLVIETTQFRGGSSGLTSPNMHLIERLTRLDPDTVAYEYTITDPTTYTAPYTVMMPFRRTDGPLFEYACHEGNIGLYGILAGARELELQGRELRR